MQVCVCVCVCVWCVCVCAHVCMQVRARMCVCVVDDCRRDPVLACSTLSGSPIPGSPYTPSPFPLRANESPTYLELHLTALAVAARPLDLQDSVPAGVLDGEPGEDEGAVLLDGANGRSNW